MRRRRICACEWHVSVLNCVWANGWMSSCMREFSSMCVCVCATGHSFMSLCINSTLSVCVICVSKGPPPPPRKHAPYCMQRRGRSSGRQRDVPGFTSLRKHCGVCEYIADITRLSRHLAGGEVFNSEGRWRSTGIIWKKNVTYFIYSFRSFLDRLQSEAVFERKHTMQS